jgi:membrane protein DedA with SNARE-associated domain
MTKRDRKGHGAGRLPGARLACQTAWGTPQQRARRTFSMDFDSVRTATIDFVRDHQAWAPFIVAGLAFCESLAFLSLLVPATVILVGIGALIGAIDLAFWPIWLGGAVGAALGDWVSYEVGRYFEDKVHHVWPLSRRPDLVAKGEAFCRRWGVWGIFIGRFFGPARAVVPLIAGIFEMPRIPFQLANVASALVWAFGLLAPGAGLMEYLNLQ